MTSVKKYRVILEITVQEIDDEATAQAHNIKSFKDHINTLDGSTKINDILKSDAWNSFYQTFDPHTKGVLKGAFWSLVRYGYGTIAEVRALSLELLSTFRNFGERRISFVSEIFDIH